ncbi:MAG: hypothetical protein Q9191_005952 [Dirinaria sp. TL-2023a]
MPFKSVLPPLDIPKCNVLDHIFPPNKEPSDVPIWINAHNPEQYLTPRQLLEWVKKLAVGLDRLGVERGQPIMIFTPNHIFVPVAYLGIAGSGRIFSELAYQIEDTKASVLLAHPDVISTALAAAHKAGLPKERVFLFSDESKPETEGLADWRSILGSDDEATRYRWNTMNEWDAVNTVATINYSSGTTGLPKGVCVSHYNLIANVEQTASIRYAYEADRRQDRPLERWIGVLPLYHAFGQLYACLLVVKREIPIYIVKTFVFEEFLRIIQTHRITHLQTAPPVVVMLSKRPETAKFDLRSLSHIACGAAPLSGELQNGVCERLNVSIGQGWGMTEIVCTGMLCPQGYENHPGSVGMLVANCECKLLDENGEEVSAGAPGELFISGPNVCLGYWRNEEATKDAISPDGWFRTGDVAIRKDNLFWIVDRKKDQELIKVRGFQVAPAELEAVLLENDDIADAAVVGVVLSVIYLFTQERTDISRHGEECPRAYVSLKEHSKDKTSAAEIQAWMRNRVTRHKQLSGGICFVDQVPKSPSGKILRKIMRDWAKRDISKLESQGRAKL